MFTKELLFCTHCNFQHLGLEWWEFNLSQAELEGFAYHRYDDCPECDNGELEALETGEHSRVHLVRENYNAI